MAANYTSIFAIALLINVLITFRSSALYTKWFTTPAASSAGGAASGALTSPQDDATNKETHKKLLMRYLFVYLLATLSDWFQGPYVYALYDQYGFSQHDIAVLFVAGFGSSMVFGSFIGGMADWGGRRRFVVLFSIIYAASCLTKHFNDYNILMLGRLLGGVATSLLFSVFDAWLIRSHSDAQLPKSFLGKSFSWAAYGNSIIAIVAGLVANKAANMNEMLALTDSSGQSGMLHVGGYLNPFDLALIALVICGVGAIVLWDENYGTEDASSGGGIPKKEGTWYSGLTDAFVATIRSRDILLCGIISSLFEGSMYIFVFMWTPALKALTEEGADLPFGIIFSTFMVSCMAGSSLFSCLIGSYKGEMLGVGVFCMSAISMGVICAANSDTITFCMMLVFEMMVGMYWPIMGTLKGSIVPEDKRAAIYNLYRIPLNFIVLFSLLTDLTPTQSFTLNAIMLSVATFLQFVLMKRRSLTGETTTSPAAAGETESLVENADGKTAADSKV